MKSKIKVIDIAWAILLQTFCVTGKELWKFKFTLCFYSLMVDFT